MRGSRIESWIGLGASLGVLVLAGQAMAQQGGAQINRSMIGGEGRTLNGHAFLPSELVVWPFVTTHFGTTTGVGLAKFARLGQDADGNLIEGSMALGAFGEGFDIGVAITDWIGLYGRFNGMLTAGANLESALSVGAIFNVDSSFGVAGRIFRRGPFQLGARFGGGYMFGRRMQPLDMLQTDENGSISLQRGRLLTKLSGWRLGPALTAAYAPTAWLGLQTSFSFEYGKLTMGEVTADNKTFAFATGIAFNGRSLRVPIAIPVFYQLTRSLEEGARVEHRTESGIYYSGRTNLDLGLAAATKLGGDDKEYLGQFRMNYYW
jgi:hypothetical protein